MKKWIKNCYINNLTKVDKEQWYMHKISEHADFAHQAVFTVNAQIGIFLE